jgi:hypothetical protein
MSRILVFSPYAQWPFHNTYEGIIAKSCQIRGSIVEHILCDGLLPECDMHWDSKEAAPRPFDLCQRCQINAKANLAKFDFQYRWLGEFVDPAEKERAFAWAQSLSSSEMYHGCYMDYPLGDWVRSSVIAYFRQYPLDFYNWHVVNVFRGFLFSAAIAAIGLTNYLALHSIDAALLFNGRQSITRVALEIFRMRGIRVLTHERPEYQPGGLNVKPNEHCMSLRPFTEFWRKWGQVPLTRPSLEKTFNWLIHRRYGTNLAWLPFNTPGVSNSSLRNNLNLSYNKRLMVLFTSSTDETATDPGFKGPYESQSLWVEDIVEWVRNRNDVELVIRVHPNLAGNSYIGRANDEFNFYHKMKSQLPGNTRIIMPDDPLNSYDLTDEADVGLTFGSVIGIEMAMLGKPVVLGSRGFYEDGSRIMTVRSKESLPELLERSLQPYSAREIQREAFRMAYYYVFAVELPFPLASPEGLYGVKLNYTSPEALTPGQDNTLDRICDFLIKDHPLYDAPTDAELAQTTADEDAFFAELDQSPEPFRDAVYERSLRRAEQLDRFGRTIQNALERLPFMSGNVLIRAGKTICLPLLRWTVKKV